MDIFSFADIVIVWSCAAQVAVICAGEEHILAHAVMNEKPEILCPCVAKLRKVKRCILNFLDDQLCSGAHRQIFRQQLCESDGFKQLVVLEIVVLARALQEQLRDVRLRAPAVPD